MSVCARKRKDILRVNLRFQNGEPVIYNKESGTDRELYLARGHLAPEADFVYEAEQNATYYYWNTAPQFQRFNGGNWVALEKKVRGYSTSHSAELEVFTGTHGQLELRGDEPGEAFPFFGRDDKLIPAPLYFWKVVNDPENGETFAFVGLVCTAKFISSFSVGEVVHILFNCFQNDVHATSAPTPLCSDVCSIVASGWFD